MQQDEKQNVSRETLEGSVYMLDIARVAQDVEAREFAMDAENSNKKHAAFGKYKGRINNYLAKRGYNLTKEREEWAKRVKARGGTL